MRIERFAQSLLRFIHQIAWTRFGEDANVAFAEHERFAARVLEIDAAKHHVRAARGRIDADAEVAQRVRPGGFVDDGDLTTAALIGVADDAASGNELRFLDAIHWTAVEAFDPDGGDLTHERNDECRMQNAECRMQNAE